MTHRVKYHLLRGAFLFLCLLTVACGSYKKGLHHSPKESKAIETNIQSLLTAERCEGLSSKIKITLRKGEEKPYSFSGNLKIKRGRGVQIGITALGIMEIARIEFTPDSVLLLNRVGKEYSVIPYEQLDWLSLSGVRYAQLEAILLNEIFSPDGEPLSQSHNAFRVEKDSIGWSLYAKPYRKMEYRFQLDSLGERLLLTQGNYKGLYEVTCYYSSFQSAKQGGMPERLLFCNEHEGRLIELEIELSGRRSPSFDWQPTSPSSSYKKIEAAQLLKRIGQSL